MYIRFVTQRRDTRARAEVGFFEPAAALEARCRRAGDPWQVREIGRELRWFAANLAVPDRFTVQAPRRRGARNGVCWFRDSAPEHVSRARYVAFLLGEVGIAVEELRSKRPGTILWSDRHQIVALPGRDHPRVFP
ncbi:MAG: hypothetical protein QNJ13_03755 [Paracoccaceae bacterium]|nr:hypothetical protein [Paracoccaceae bacterium]